MNINEIRKSNLNFLLMREVVEAGKRGAKKRLSEKAKTAPAYISQLLAKDGSANIGDDLARRLEQAYGLNHGAMDSLMLDREDLSEFSITPENVVPPQWPFVSTYDDFLALPFPLFMYLHKVVDGICQNWDAELEAAQRAGRSTNDAILASVEKYSGSDAFHRWFEEGDVLKALLQKMPDQ